MIDWITQWYNVMYLFPLCVGFGMVGLSAIGFTQDSLDVDGDGIADIPFLLPFPFLGKLPISILIQVYSISLGISGLLFNAIAHDLIAAWDVYTVPLTLPLALFVSALLTWYVATVIVLNAPQDKATARRSGEFVGSLGVAVTSITSIVGQVRVKSEDNTTPDFILNAYQDSKDSEPILRGAEVYLVGYDKTRNLYLVTQNPTQ